MTSEAQKSAGYLLPEQIDGHDLICLRVNVPNVREYRAAVRGALYELTKWWNWEKTYQAGDTRATRAAAYWRELIAGTLYIGDCAEGLPGEGDCVEFGTDADLITWEPQNPFTEPNLVPSGYILPPFQLVTPTNLLQFVGYQVGDVLTDILRFPAGTGVLIDPESGFARFRVSVTGEGVVELHFLNVPLGGYALVTRDANPLLVSLVELNLDAFSVPPENNQVIVHEVPFDTPGSHFIDVTFVPRLNDEAPGVFYGGGIRKVVLCGFDAQGGDSLFDIRQPDATPCIIEKTLDGTTWTPAVDLTKCPPRVRINNGVIEWLDPDTDTWEELESGDEREDGSAPTPYPGAPDGACIAAENIASVYVDLLAQVRSDVAAGKSAAAIAAGAVGFLSVFIAPALIGSVALGLASAALALGEAQITVLLSVSNVQHFKCKCRDNLSTEGVMTSVGFAQFRGELDARYSSFQQEIVLGYVDALGPIGITRQAKAAGVTTADCSECDSGCFGCGSPDQDFAANRGTLQLIPYAVPVGVVGTIKAGLYVPGTGFQTQNKPAVFGVTAWRGLQVQTCLSIPVGSQAVQMRIRAVSGSPTYFGRRIAYFSGGGVNDTGANTTFNTTPTWYTVLSANSIVPVGQTIESAYFEFGNRAAPATTPDLIIDAMRVINC